MVQSHSLYSQIVVFNVRKTRVKRKFGMNTPQDFVRVWLASKLDDCDVLSEVAIRNMTQSYASGRSAWFIWRGKDKTVECTEKFGGSGVVMEMHEKKIN